MFFGFAIINVIILSVILIVVLKTMDDAKSYVLNCKTEKF